MAAFVIFVRTYGLWIFLLCLIGVIVGVKLLVDARRLSRTTLFSLEQERAGDQTVRALLMIAAAVVILTLTALVGMLAAPTPESPIARAPTATLAPLFFPSSTPSPIPTATFFFTPKPSDPPPFAGTPVSATATRTTTRPIIVPTPAPTVTPTPLMPAPTITAPPNGNVYSGEGQANAAITFRWNCELCKLGPNDWYVVVISFVDKTGMSQTYAGKTRDNFLPLKRVYDGGGFELYHKAKEDTFQWFVQVKREPGDLALSPPSATWKFVWH
ncbi:MAG: hypothetical protein HY868_01710 [Chloroflexi bacterium]|nr:hypothetical protein [Chloroflexota bacterium]